MCECRWNNLVEKSVGILRKLVRVVNLRCNDLFIVIMKSIDRERDSLDSFLCEMFLEVNIQLSMV